MSILKISRTMKIMKHPEDDKYNIFGALIDVNRKSARKTHVTCTCPNESSGNNIIVLSKSRVTLQPINERSEPL